MGAELFNELLQVGSAAALGGLPTAPGPPPKAQPLSGARCGVHYYGELYFEYPKEKGHSLDGSGVGFDARSQKGPCRRPLHGGLLENGLLLADHLLQWPHRLAH